MKKFINKNSKYITIVALIAIMVGCVVAYLIDPAIGLGAGIAFKAISPLAGYIKACGAKSGGIRRLWITEAANVTSFTLNADVFATVTMEGAGVFYKYEFERDTCEWKDTTSFENRSKKVTHDLELKLDHILPAARLELEAIADASHCGMIAIVEDNNGTKWVLGYSDLLEKDRPLELLTDESVSGKQLTDANGSTIKFQGIDTQKARAFTGTVVDNSIVTP